MRAKKPVDECYPEFVRLWVEAYPDLGFDAVSGKKIKSLIQKTKWRLKLGEKEPTLQATVAAFQYVMAYVKRVNHFCHGKPITTFESQYLSIIHEIKHGRQPRKNPSAFDIINSL